MSRQPGPSMVLSVLIVCFFAVALFQHDLPRKRSGSARSSERESSGWTSPSTPPSTRSGPTRNLVVTSRSTVPDETSSKSGTRTTSSRVDITATASVNVSVDEHRAGRATPANFGSNSPAGRSQQPSPRALGQQRVPAEVPRDLSRQKKITRSSSPRSAFTIAQPSETLEDVSFRVYGTTELADSLWQANRDTLPNRKSRLSTGMLLRTPSTQ
jgi:hypothetical protein